MDEGIWKRRSAFEFLHRSRVTNHKCEAEGGEGGITLSNVAHMAWPAVVVNLLEGGFQSECEGGGEEERASEHGGLFAVIRSPAKAGVDNKCALCLSQRRAASAREPGVYEVIQTEHCKCSRLS